MISLRTFMPCVFILAGMAVCANATTLGPNSELVATFTTAANTSDMLWFFDNTPVTVTGTPTITVDLFNGNNLLGTYTESAGSTLLEIAFQSPSSLWATPVNPTLPTVVNFSSINAAGSSDNLLVVVTGGTITFNNSDLVLYDGKAVNANSFLIQSNVSNISYTLGVPEPSGLLLSGLGLGVLAFIRRNE